MIGSAKQAMWLPWCMSCTVAQHTVPVHIRQFPACMRFWTYGMMTGTITESSRNHSTTHGSGYVENEDKGSTGELFRVVIDRGKWLRGSPELSSAIKALGSYLLCGDVTNVPLYGRKCCMGFAATALGFKDNEILERGLPSDLCGSDTEAGLGTHEKELYDTLCSVETRLAAYNDGPTSSEEAREEEIHALAASAGFDFQFTDSE